MNKKAILEMDSKVKGTIICGLLACFLKLIALSYHFNKVSNSRRCTSIIKGVLASYQCLCNKEKADNLVVKGFIDIVHPIQHSLLLYSCIV